MAIKLIQPYPDHASQIVVPPEARVPCHLPVRFVKFRFKSHAAPSGYDRICDYVDAPTIRLSQPLYWVGETVLRPYTWWTSKCCGKYEYSRYDSTMELAALGDFLTSRDRLYHFVYAEKSFHLTERVAGTRGHKLVGTIHHPNNHQSWLFESHAHFRAFDQLITMDEASIPFWEEISGKSNVTWLPHGVDTDYFVPLARRPDGPFCAVFAGVHERDFDALDKVIAAVRERRRDIHFDLIGANPKLAALAASYSGVRQMQNLPDEDYRSALQRADLLFLPLRASTVCNVVLEAMACGTPVLTTRGGIEAYLDEACAKIVDVGDVSAMIDAVLVEAGIASGPQLSRVAARRKAESFSWQEVARMHVALYASVVGEKAFTGLADNGLDSRAL